MQALKFMEIEVQSKVNIFKINKFKGKWRPNMWNMYPSHDL